MYDPLISMDSAFICLTSNAVFCTARLYWHCIFSKVSSPWHSKLWMVASSEELWASVLANLTFLSIRTKIFAAAQCQTDFVILQTISFSKGKLWRLAVVTPLTELYKILLLREAMELLITLSIRLKLWITVLKHKIPSIVGKACSTATWTLQGQFVSADLLFSSSCLILNPFVVHGDECLAVSLALKIHRIIRACWILNLFLKPGEESLALFSMERIFGVCAISDVYVLHEGVCLSAF